MVQTGFNRIYDLASWLMPIAEGFIKGYCLYRFADPFMLSLAAVSGSCSTEGMEICLRKKRKGAAFGGLAFFLTMLLCFILQISKDVYVIYGMAGFVMFLVIYRIDRRNYRQKFFLMITFFSLNLFAMAMAEILHDYLYNAIYHIGFVKNHPNPALYLDPVLYALMCICYLVLEFVFTAASIWQVVRAYKDKEEEMGQKELVMLAFPSLMGVIGYEIMRYYRGFYILETGKTKKAYDSLMFLYCAVSSITIIVVIMMYQKIKTRQEENQQAKLLAAQINSIRRHIEQVEELYGKVRSIRHDMTNHILTLERLYEGNKEEEAEAYGRRLKTELTRLKGEMESGNPVTDVVLQEFAGEAERRGILFCSDFHYPADSVIDAFDVSVVLNNALQNAVENTWEGEEKRISIMSYRRNNAYIIKICNSFTGQIKWNTQSGLPVTSKEKEEGHGCGLPSIRSVAAKYAGDIDITLKDGMFCLYVMLILG